MMAVSLVAESPYPKLLAENIPPEGLYRVGWLDENASIEEAREFYQHVQLGLQHSQVTMKSYMLLCCQLGRYFLVQQRALSSAAWTEWLRVEWPDLDKTRVELWMQYAQKLQDVPPTSRLFFREKIVRYSNNKRNVDA